MSPERIKRNTDYAHALRNVSTNSGGITPEEAKEQCTSSWEDIRGLNPGEDIPKGEEPEFSKLKAIVRKASDGRDGVTGFQGMDAMFKIAGMLDRRVTEETAVGEKQKLDMFKQKDEKSTKRVFVVHGHDDPLRLEIENLLRKVGLEPIILHDQISGGKSVAEKLEKYSDVGFAIVIMTPDDVGGSAAVWGSKMAFQLPKRARQNVVLELGYFWGELGRERVCALMKGNVEKPSDYEGIVYVKYEGDWKLTLFRELRGAGMVFDATKA